MIHVTHWSLLNATIIEVILVRQVEFKLICPNRKVFKARLILVYL